MGAKAQPFGRAFVALVVRSARGHSSAQRRLSSVQRGERRRARSVVTAHCWSLYSFQVRRTWWLLLDFWPEISVRDHLGVLLLQRQVLLADFAFE